MLFRVFYDSPGWGWRTEGSPFVHQVPGNLKTHIIHSCLSILNFKTIRAYRSSSMDIPPVPNQPKTFKFPQRSFSQKNPVKRSFQSSLFAFIERGYITRYVCMLLTETES